MDSMIKSGSPNSKAHLHINEFHSHLDFNCLNIIYNQKLFCDIVLVAEGMEIQAHKLILASSSTYFYWRFSNDRHLQLLNRIEIHNVKFNTLFAVVQYLYKSEIFIREDNVRDLLAAAHLLVLCELEEACRDFLEANLSPSNCIGTEIIAKHCRCEKLASVARDFTLANFSEVTKEEEFLEITFDNMLNLISSDVLNTVEEDVLESVIKWVKHDLYYRKGHVYNLFKNIQFSLIPQNNILQKLEAEKWLTSDPQYTLFLLEVLKRHIEQRPQTFSRCCRQSSKCLMVVGATSEKMFKMEMYDLQKNIWLRGPEYQGIKFDGASTRFAVLGTKIYHIDGKAMKSIDISDPAQKIWSDCSQMMTTRKWYSIAVLNNSIYAVGGKHQGSNLRKEERFDVLSGEWKSVAEMPECRISVGLGVLKGNLYAFGGRKLISSSWECCSSVECYNPDSDSWFAKPNMSIERSQVGVAALGYTLYVVGGNNNEGSCKQVEAFNLTDLSWKRLPDMHIARRLPGVITANGLLYVIGGGGNLNSVEVYNPKTNTWSLLPNRMNTGKSCVTVSLVDRVNIKLTSPQ